MLEIKSEDDLYNHILTYYSQHQRDIENSGVELWRDLTMNRLMRLLKKGGVKCHNAVRNALILLLTLFNKKHQGIDLHGADLSQIDPTDRKSILQDLQVALF